MRFKFHDGFFYKKRKDASAVLVLVEKKFRLSKDISLTSDLTRVGLLSPDCFCVIL